MPTKEQQQLAVQETPLACPYCGGACERTIKPEHYGGVYTEYCPNCLSDLRFKVDAAGVGIAEPVTTCNRCGRGILASKGGKGWCTPCISRSAAYDHEPDYEQMLEDKAEARGWNPRDDGQL